MTEWKTSVTVKAKEAYKWPKDVRFVEQVEADARLKGYKGDAVILRAELDAAQRKLAELEKCAHCNTIDCKIMRGGTGSCLFPSTPHKCDKCYWNRMHCGMYDGSGTCHKWRARTKTKKVRK